MRSPDAEKVAYENDNVRIDIYAKLDDQAHIVLNHNCLINLVKELQRNWPQPNKTQMYGCDTVVRLSK